jgi:hypothetical protein
MKKLFLFCLLLVFASYSNSQVEYKWSAISYLFEAGPLPPIYQYHYTITINSNCDGGVVCFIGTDESAPSLTYDFKVSADSLSLLSDAIEKSKILEEDIERLPEGKHPIGGHLEKVRVIFVSGNPNLDQPPRVKESPYFPTEKYKENLEKLYETIKAVVPSKIWDDIETKKQEYQKSHE